MYSVSIQVLYTILLYIPLSFNFHPSTDTFILSGPLGM